MIAANLRHRAKRPERLAILGIAGVAALAGTAATRRFLSRARNTPEARRTAGAAGTGRPLIGHEFRYFGDRFRILESSRDTEDGSTRADYFAAPGARVPGHVHRDQEERFEVVSGTLGVRVGGRELILGSGQSAVGPAGVPHAWWNPSDGEEVRFLAELRPGLDVEILLETVLGLARDGKTIGGTIPKNPLQLAVLAQEVGSWAYLTDIPKPARKALFAPVASLAFVGRRLGYRTHYPEYGSSEGATDGGGGTDRFALTAVAVVVGAAVLAFARLRRRGGSRPRISG